MTDAERAQWVRWLETLTIADTPIVGGKNSSLGEMAQALRGAGIRLPEGFATTAQAYREFIAANELEGGLRAALAELAAGRASLEEAGAQIRGLILGGTFPGQIAEAIRAAYAELCGRLGREDADVAVRSSATAEDLPSASFAGQQETFLNIRGADALLDACRRCFASLFTDRAIAYREQNGIGQLDVALSVGAQQMVRSDLAGAGVLFTIDVDTGFPRMILINAAWGLGENVVQGTIEPDQYRVFKPFLEGGGRAVVQKVCGEKERKRIYAAGGERTAREGTAGEVVVGEEAKAEKPMGETTTRDVATTPEERAAFVLADDEIVQLGRWAVLIERHYQRPMDIEWAKDGRTGELFIVQARPETVQARQGGRPLTTYELKESGPVLVTGLAIGQAIAAGTVRRILDLKELDRFQPGDVLVTTMTSPDWFPLMRRAAAVVTDHGGRTSHAAIVSRELGLPAVVGAGNATEVLREGQEVTVSSAGGGDNGFVYDGRLRFETREVDLSGLPSTRTRILMNIASPPAALAWWRLPVRGIGLARMEYLINNVIRIHPMALAHFERIEDDEVRSRIEALTRRYPDKREYFVDQLSRGLALMAASRFPDPVVVRTSDFKTNEYAQLIGGRQFEPLEEDPMLGWRGASRYYDDDYRDGFALECRALKRAREEMGFRNIVVMIPFCRTPEEADRVLQEMAAHGLRRGEAELRVWVMAEIPSNILQAEEFAERFDGFSIGSNDLTQLVLGVSRDSAKLRGLFDERSPSVKWLIRELARRAHETGRSVSLCGEAPSNYPEFAAFLVEAGLDSISVNPDSVIQVIERVARAESAAATAGKAEAA
jgi:pyruvate,water dikinase